MAQPFDSATADPTRDRLLDHTLEVLLSGGRPRFSMNAVAASAKASKETLYRHFGDKSGLLHAALVRSAEQIGPLLCDGLETTTTRHDRLRRLGVNYLHGSYRPESIALRRVAYADTEHGLGALFVTVITDRAVDVVAAEFESLGSSRPRSDAELFLGMLQGKLHERVSLGVASGDLDALIDDQVDRAVEVIEAHLDASTHR